jgi:hypothetical protein
MGKRRRFTSALLMHFLLVDMVSLTLTFYSRSDDGIIWEPLGPSPIHLGTRRTLTKESCSFTSLFSNLI